MSLLFSKASIVFFAIGLFSMFLHGVKKWTLGEIQGNLIDWYVMNPRATIGSVIACGGGIATAILSGALLDYAVGAQILAAAGIGYASDGLNNQGVK